MSRVGRTRLGVTWLATLAIGLLLPGVATAQTETVEYYGLDAVGSVRIVFTASGAVLGRMDYGPFGEELTASTALPTNRFAELLRDGESGLDYAQARMYQFRTGRFGTVDPVYAGLFEPQRWNRYSYALNSPITQVDPSGLVVFYSGASACGQLGQQPEFAGWCHFQVQMDLWWYFGGGGGGGGWGSGGWGSEGNEFDEYGRGGSGGQLPPPPGVPPPTTPTPPNPPPPPPPPPPEPKPPETGWRTPFWNGCGDGSNWWSRTKENFQLTNSFPGAVLPSGLGIGLRVGETVKNALGIPVAAPHGVLTQGALAVTPSTLTTVKWIVGRSAVGTGVGLSYEAGVGIGSGIRAGLFCN